jgi:inhibitor of KinA sporulation pathway (predicted exonuclease)
MHYIILDLEATCWQGNLMDRRQEVIELGACMLDPYGDLLGTFQAFVRPVENPHLSAYCTDLTGIQQEDVRKAPTFDIAIERYFAWMESFEAESLLCTWGAKDIPILKAECDVHDADPFFLHPAIDLKAQFARIMRLPSEVGLQKALGMIGFEFEGTAHRAFEDAQNTAGLFRRFIDQWEF